MGEVPIARWAVDRSSVASGALHGGFVSGLQLLDNAAFAVSPAEAAAMDPQQRLLLEHGYEALHAAQLDRASLGGSLTGVFVGIARTTLRTTGRLACGRERVCCNGQRAFDCIWPAVVRPRSARGVRRV